MTTVRPLNYRINNHSLFRYLISFCMITSVWNNTSLLERSQGIFMYPSHCCMDCCWQVTKSNNYYQAKKKKHVCCSLSKLITTQQNKGCERKPWEPEEFETLGFGHVTQSRLLRDRATCCMGCRAGAAGLCMLQAVLAWRQSLSKRAARLLWFCLSPHMLVVLCLFDAVCTCEGIEPNCNLSFVCI